MYRRYKAGKETPGQNTQPQNPCSSATEHSDLEVTKQVEECWKTIQHICSQEARIQQKIPDPKVILGEWQTVRIFVSSTFNDFFNEREVLVKKVFPELREWCHPRKIKLVECDLRWGVPKDATSTQALVTCLEEIDRCYEANGQPFFLTLLGDRYGWVPEKNDVPAEVREKYSWVDGTSMTFMEILHGALRMSNPNAAFFLRDPGFISQLPDEHADRFRYESPLAGKHLKELKKQLTKLYPQQVFSYAVDFKGISCSTGREQVDLTGLDTFSEQVKEYFQTVIEKTYPQNDTNVELTPEQKETDLQWMFVQEKAEMLIGRDKELQLLHGYANGTPEAKLEKIGKPEEWDTQKGVNPICVVTAEGGWGKTALLAGLVQQAVKQGQKVFYHFVGSTASSRYHINLVRRLLWALAAHSTDPKLEDQETDIDTLKNYLLELLAVWKSNNKDMLMVIDGVNELDNSGSVDHLSWLPPFLPFGLRCIVSTNVTHIATTARLYDHPVYHLTLCELNTSALMDIAFKYFGNFGKRLESNQLQQMVSRTKVDNPFWMVLMCEELRIFGDFRMLDRRLDSLPDSMDAFLVTVIHRLLAEDDTGCVQKTLFLTACSSNGLPTDYILQLLGNIESKIDCPPLYWAQARRVLKPYIRTMFSSYENVEYFTFVHEAMLKAVRQSMETVDMDIKVWHKQLADFYQFGCDNSVLRANYLPFQLKQARLQKRLIDFVRHDRDALRIPAFQRSRYLCELRCYNTSDAVVPSTKELMICQMCQNRHGGFNHGVVFPNKNVCYLCSNNVTFANNRQPARICFMHAVKSRTGPNVSRCCICSKPVFLSEVEKNKSFGPVQAFLCQFCKFGIYGTRCCEFQDVTE